MPAKHLDNALKRSLPKKSNPLLAADKTPEHTELVKKRRLGQTDLAVKPGQVGVSSATKPENLGLFDYAHLRAPLPDNLKGSEIFAPHQSQSPPESYFLMRRSSDGFVSATGMFKAAFPWAKHSEEQSEKDYLKGLPSTAQDEVAGNVWISEHYAIELADEYGIVGWIAALLDAAAVEQSPEDPHRTISPPPKFKFTAGDKQHLPPPNGTPARGSTPKSRGRPRGTSPAKSMSPQKTARKPREKKATKAENAETAREASASLQAALDTAAATSGAIDGETVKINVESNVQTKGDTETTTTNVQIEMPVGLPDMPLPENPEEMIQKAKEMVQQAVQSDGGEGSSGTKRKADEMIGDSDSNDDEELQPAKRARVLQQQIKKEKVRTRALIGVAATLAIGHTPYIFVIVIRCQVDEVRGWKKMIQTLNQVFG